MQDNKPPPTFISSHDFAILCDAFKTSVAEGLVAERHWVQHVKELIRELTDDHEPEESLINRIIAVQKGQNG